MNIYGALQDYIKSELKENNIDCNIYETQIFCIIEEILQDLDNKIESIIYEQY